VHFTATIVHEEPACYIPLPFDPASVFGKARAPVRVTLRGYTYRSTIAAMGGQYCIPLRRSHREAAGVKGGQSVRVRLELDSAPRVVTPPPDLRRALAATPGALARWRALSYTHQREHVEAIMDAKKPETRVRRIERAVRSCWTISS
jgi:hypothetical protein